MTQYFKQKTLIYAPWWKILFIKIFGKKYHELSSRENSCYEVIMYEFRGVSYLTKLERMR